MTPIAHIRESLIRPKISTLFEPLMGLNAWHKMGIIHTRGKYAAGDTSKVILLENEIRNSTFPNMETKGIFIIPYDFGVPGEAQSGSAYRSYYHQITWICEYNDDRRDDAFAIDDPAGELDSSFDFFCDRIDTIIEILDFNTALGFTLSDDPNVNHTLLRTQEPLYDHIVDEVGVYHFSKFTLETRVMVPVARC